MRGSAPRASRQAAAKAEKKEPKEAEEAYVMKPQKQMPEELEEEIRRLREAQAKWREEQESKQKRLKDRAMPPSFKGLSEVELAAMEDGGSAASGISKLASAGGEGIKSATEGFRLVRILCSHILML